MLDCPCGPASFVSEGRKRGIDIVGCDPLFGFSASKLRALGEADIADCMQQIRKSQPDMAGGDPEGYEREKRAALDALIADFTLRGPAGTDPDGRYLAAALPNLPFADRAFDIALSAHFLFSYAPVESGGVMDSNEFDLPFHFRAATELARVAREIHLYPTYEASSLDPKRHPYAEPMVNHLRSIGMTARYEPSTYDQGAPNWNYSIVAAW